LIVADLLHKPAKTFIYQPPKLAKGFIRLGHDVRLFNYTGALNELSCFKSKTLTRLFYKRKADHLLSVEVKAYKPDVVHISFPRALDGDTVEHMRKAAPNAVFIGFDGDLWPTLRGERINVAKKLDIVTATNNGEFLRAYEDAGVPKCAFMPNMCDPDTDHRYDVEDKWKKDILWTGLIIHDPKRYPGERMRYEIISRMAKMPNCVVYGCCGKSGIGGIDYLFAISGAKIGLSINADNNIRLYHSDRLTHYLACGTCVLAKKVPDSDLLFKDKLHLRYFETAEEFFELADWFLKHEDERKRIADAGMKWMHEQFNCVKITGYILDLIEKGDYNAPWNQAL
jgi:glycosyltransferase involved in cell wall biosynthesis